MSAVTVELYLSIRDIAVARPVLATQEPSLLVEFILPSLISCIVSGCFINGRRLYTPSQQAWCESWFLYVSVKRPIRSITLTNANAMAAFAARTENHELKLRWLLNRVKNFLVAHYGLRMKLSERTTDISSERAET